jgi:hypothetical protein
MPREVSTSVAPIGSVTAAAMAYPGLSKVTRKASNAIASQSWQKEAWRYYDEVGEFRYGVNWSSNVCSRATLYVSRRNPDGSHTRLTEEQDGPKALHELTNGVVNQPEFIRMMTLHLFVVGEFYLVNRKQRVEDDPLHGMKYHGTSLWEVVGTEEISYTGEQWWLQYDNGTKVRLSKEDVVIRCWKPHPKNRYLADSPTKAALPILREIRGFDHHISAQQDSRLTGSGILFLPSEMTVKPPEGVNNLSTADIVVSNLVDAASASKSGIGTAEAQVPLVFTAPGDLIKNITHIKLWSELDAGAQTMREAALKRLAATLDLPQEIVTGTSQMNRWGAWQVEESSVKAHIEPMLATLASMLTSEYLHIATLDDTQMIQFDTASLRLRPNRSKEAIELYDRGLLKGSTALRETGFTSDDAPTEEESKRWILMQMVKASWSPDQAQAAAKALGVDLGLPSTDNQPREARPIPSLQQHPVRDIPKKTVSDGTREMPTEAAVAAMVVYRALERSGNRLRTLTGSKPDVSSENTHTAITVFPDRIEDLMKGSFEGCETFGMSQQMVEKSRKLCREYLLRGIEFQYGDAVRKLS